MTTKYNSVASKMLLETAPPQLEGEAPLETLRDLVHLSAFVAHSKGWWDPYPGRLTTRWLFESELAEAFEELRKGKLETYYSETDHGPKPEGFFVELADLSIRAADTAGRVLATSSASFAEYHLKETGNAPRRLKPLLSELTERNGRPMAHQLGDQALESLGLSSPFYERRAMWGPTDEQDVPLVGALTCLSTQVTAWWIESATRHGSLTHLTSLICLCSDIAEASGFNLAELAAEKSRYNYKRSYRHGNKAC